MILGWTWYQVNQLQVIQVDSSQYSNSEVQDTLLYIYSESMVEYGVVRIVVYHNA